MSPFSSSALYDALRLSFTSQFFSRKIPIKPFLPQFLAKFYDFLAYYRQRMTSQCCKIKILNSSLVLLKLWPKVV